MTIGSSGGLIRSIPALVALALVLAAPALLAACGGEPTPAATVTVTATPSAGVSASPSVTSNAQTVLTVFFLRGDKLGTAERRVPKTTAVARAAMDALCYGVTASEANAGLSTAVPSGTNVRSLDVKNGVATVDLTSRFAAGGGSLSMQARVAQVVYTLTQFPTVKSVKFMMNGAPLETLGGEGLMLDTPQRRAQWVSFEPPIFLEKPGVGALVSSPCTLSGTASVFEGTFNAVLTTSGGEKLAHQTIQASMGAPERGTFQATLSFTATTGNGIVTVYETSMKDGSHLNVVKVPVTFGAAQ